MVSQAVTPTGSPGHPGDGKPDGSNGGSIAAVVIVVLIFGAAGWYFLRTQERRNALRSALGISAPDGYQAVRQRAHKAKYDVELSDNLLYGSDDDDEDSDGSDGVGGGRGASTPTDDA